LGFGIGKSWILVYEGWELCDDAENIFEKFEIETKEY